MANIDNGGPAFPVPNPESRGPATYAELTRLAEGMSLRAYLAAHADVSEFDIEDRVLELRSNGATFTSEPASDLEIADAIADLKVMQADALIRRLERGEA